MICMNQKHRMIPFQHLYVKDKTAEKYVYFL